MGEISDINLDKIVSDFRRVAQSSINEEELRIGAMKTIEDNITSILGVKMGRHEYSLISGVRADALYNHVLIEYRHPGSLSTDSGFSHAKNQIINSIAAEAEVKENFKNYFGIVISDKISFVKYDTTAGDWVARGPYDIHKEVVLKIMEALRGLRRKKLSAGELLDDFGPRSETACKTINALYDRLDRTASQKTKLLFQEWVRIFSQITGYSEEDLKGLDQLYDTSGKDCTKLLFCIHTYYAIFMKIIAAELAYLYAGRYLRSYTEELDHKHTQGVEEFKTSMKDLEEGGVFKKLLKIENFIEGGYFSWYLEEFDHELMHVIAEIARKLAEYEPATPVLEPEETKDMLKIIYQDLVPRPIRHNLGEYYTPDWLAQFLLDEVGFTLEFFEKRAKNSKDPTSPLDLRLIDPACGSGTFLIEALKRLRKYAEDHCITDMMSKCVLKNVVGMDLNPLAVLAARTNYLLIIGDLLSYVHEIELPIYLADSMTIKEKSTRHGNTWSIETQAGECKIPSKIVENKERLEKLLKIVEECVMMKYTLEEFEFMLTKNMEDLNESEVQAVKIQLYNVFLDLEKKGKDYRVTTLLNAFAPLCMGKFDYVVGNPPWILWDNLPTDYRNSTQRLWKKYGLFTLTAAQARHGGSKKDISILFTYVCNDRYLKDSGTFGFLITQSVFKTKGAGEGFRRFELDDKKLKVVQAHDFVKVQPFEGANNKTAAIILKKGVKTTYPVKYRVWRKVHDIDQKESLKTAFKKLQSVKMAAIPSDPENELSPWITVPNDTINVVKKVYGKNAYSAYAGIYSGGANSVYWLTILELISQSKKTINIPKSVGKILAIDDELTIREILMENVTKGMKRKIEKINAIIEDFFVYPMLKSRNIKKWGIRGYNYALQMQNPLKRIGFDESWVKLNFPETYAYLRRFKDVLVKRAAYRKFMKQRKNASFYSMYNVGVYTYAPYKVVWNQMGSKITACVVSTITDEYLGEKLLLPEHVLAFIPIYSKDEAHYVCSIMNSSVTDMILRSIAGGSKSFGTPKIIEDTIRISKYDDNNELHAKLATLSKKAHECVQKGKKTEIIEKEIDDVIAELYRISERDSERIEKTLSIQEGAIPEKEE